MIQCRPAVIEDAEAIFQMIVEIAVLGGHDRKTLPVTVEKLKRYGFSKDPYFSVELAESDGEVIGYALYFFTFSGNQGAPLIYLLDLYVKPAMRSKGVGTQLMERLKNYAKERECCRLEWHVFDWNHKAQKFYEKMGAVLRPDLISVRLENKEVL